MQVWTTRSTPACKGFCRSGVDQLLSMQVRAPCERASPAIPATSATRKRIDPGLSIQTSRVAGLKAFATSAAVVPVQTECATPNRSSSAASCRVGP